MKKNSRAYLKELEKRDLSQELKCVNALQRTPWRINKNVVNVIRTVWDSGQEWAGLPPRDDLALPHYPFDVEPSDLNVAQKQDFAEWRTQRGRVVPWPIDDYISGKHTQ